MPLVAFKISFNPGSICAVIVSSSDISASSICMFAIFIIGAMPIPSMPLAGADIACAEAMAIPAKAMPSMATERLSGSSYMDTCTGSSTGSPWNLAGLPVYRVVFTCFQSSPEFWNILAFMLTSRGCSFPLNLTSYLGFQLPVFSWYLSIKGIEPSASAISSAMIMGFSSSFTAFS